MAAPMAYRERPPSLVIGPDTALPAAPFMGCQRWVASGGLLGCPMVQAQLAVGLLSVERIYQGSSSCSVILIFSGMYEVGQQVSTSRLDTSLAVSAAHRRTALL